jgi:hypothetical protein
MARNFYIPLGRFHVIFWPPKEPPQSTKHTFLGHTAETLRHGRSVDRHILTFAISHLFSLDTIWLRSFNPPLTIFLLQAYST